MARKRRERDVVAELQEDARWSAYTNETTRFRARGRPRFPRDVSVLTIMLVLTVGLGILIGGIALLLLLVRVVP